MKRITTLLLVVLISCSAFAQGYYFEMKMSSSTLGDVGTMKVYGQDGNSRSEVNMNTPMGPMGVISLVLKSKPGEIYMLSEKNKTYTEMDVNKSDQWKDKAQSEYIVTLLGKEKVNGYNSTHVMVKRKDSQLEEELWVSTEVADYSAYMTAKTKFTGQENLYKAMEAKGAVGFPVRIKTAEHGNSIQIDFVKAEKRNNPASLFSLSGYTKTENPLGGGTQKEMIEKIKNMTPEERQKLLEQMKQQYQQNH